MTLSRPIELRGRIYSTFINISQPGANDQRGGPRTGGCRRGDGEFRRLTRLTFQTVASLLYMVTQNKYFLRFADDLALLQVATAAGGEHLSPPWRIGVNGRRSEPRGSTCPPSVGGEKRRARVSGCAIAEGQAHQRRTAQATQCTEVSCHAWARKIVAWCCATLQRASPCPVNGLWHRGFDGGPRQIRSPRHVHAPRILNA